MDKLQLLRLVNAASLCFLMLSSSAFPQSLESKLAQPLATYKSNEKSSLQQLVELGQQYGIPMGIEWIDDAEPAKVKSLAAPIDLQNTSPAEVIDSILAQNKGYKRI